uniref:Sulfotransferase domain-containing protein n=1 Tax=Pseudo-nitzschia australis TaxID=44445 RepID=A0A7S4AVE0_9STRA
MVRERSRSSISSRRVLNDSSSSSSNNNNNNNNNMGNNDKHSHIHHHELHWRRRQKKPRIRRRSCMFLGLIVLVAYATLIYQSFLEVSRQNATSRRNPRFGGLSSSKNANIDNDGTRLPKPRERARTYRNNSWAYFRMSANRRQNRRQKNKNLPPETIKPVDVLYDAPEELRLPKPIINVGFPKAGTSTIFSFFHCNGLKAQHWLCCEPQNHPIKTARNKLMSRCILENLITKSPILDDCGDYDVYAEINGPRNFKEYQKRTLLEDGRLLSTADSVTMKLRIFFPQHHHLEDIHKQYPNATLILNQRSVESWIDSVLDWDIGLQYELLNEFHDQNSTRILFGTETETDGNHNPQNNNKANNNIDDLKDDQEDLKNKIRKAHVTHRKISPFTAQNIRKYLKMIHNYHLQYVRDWVAEHPSHALVEVDIAHEDAGKTLAEAFGLKEDCWGHYNKNDKDSNRGDSSNGNKNAAPPRKGNQRKMAISGQYPVSDIEPPVDPSSSSNNTAAGKKKGKQNRILAKISQNVNDYQRETLDKILNRNIMKDQPEINITDTLLSARRAG